MKESTARKTLRKARFFVSQAELCGLRDQTEFESYLEAAIVFARSITIHIQKAYKHRSGFESWYSRCRSGLESDPLCKFFIDTRNFILKQGQVGVKGVLSITPMPATAVGSVGHPTVIITSKEARDTPSKVYHRLRIPSIYEKFLAGVKHFISKFCRCYKIAWNRVSAHNKAVSHAHIEQSNTISSETFYFDDPLWRDRPALALLKKYLDKLEMIVKDAEAKFEGVT